MKKMMLFLLLLLFTSCTVLEKKKDNPPVVDKDQEIYNFYLDYKGTPYKLGGETKNGIDCSAFSRALYENVYNLSLPRTTHEQIQLGHQVEYKDRTMGDLVFFKTGPTLMHVGVYYKNDNFFHASTSKGVMMSNLNDPYWISAFFEIRRVLEE